MSYHAPVQAESRFFATTATMIAALNPREPVYCLFPHRLRAAVARFARGFPGRTLYAVKCNPLPEVIHHLREGGVHGFDTASIGEIELIRRLTPDSPCYYMAPARVIGTAAEAFRRHGVRHFVLDCEDELNSLRTAVGASKDVTFYVRLSTPGTGAMFELSSKFGTDVEEAARLLDRIAALGYKPALTFHVGSQCIDPEDYARALTMAERALELTRARIVALDVGGGFPAPYPGQTVPPLEDYFAAVTRMKTALNLSEDCTLDCEPGRALVADGMSLVTQVILRKGEKLYINDGGYGTLMEARLPGSSIHYPTRVYRRGRNGETRILEGTGQPFTLFGPSCDAYDMLPRPYVLPREIQPGDFIEFCTIGAYSAALRTHFNGFYPDTIVEIRDDDPPLA